MPNDFRRRIQMALATLRFEEEQARRQLDDRGQIFDFDVALRQVNSANLQAHKKFADAVEAILSEN